MADRHSTRRVPGIALAILLAAAITMPIAGAGAEADTPLAIDSARITLAGTSNVHDYTAATGDVRVTRVELGSQAAGPDFWQEVVRPGGLKAFEVAIPAATLTSEKKGLDKNMHKALNVKEHADITFSLLRIEPGSAGALKAIGMLQVAGVEREVVLDVRTEQTDAGLAVTGDVELLMTDFGIKPPKAMLGMLKTDPKVTVTFETLLAVPLT